MGIFQGNEWTERGEKILNRPVRMYAKVLQNNAHFIKIHSKNYISYKDRISYG